VARCRTADGGRDVRLGRVADLGLQRLVGDRLRRVDQIGQRGDAGVGGLQGLNAVADAVKQVRNVVGAAVEPRCGEEVDRVVERRVDLLAGRQAILRDARQRGRVLQREQILPDCSGKGDAGHYGTFLVRVY